MIYSDEQFALKKGTLTLRLSSEKEKKEAQLYANCTPDVRGRRKSSGLETCVEVSEFRCQPMTTSQMKCL